MAVAPSHVAGKETGQLLVGHTFLPAVPTERDLGDEGGAQKHCDKMHKTPHGATGFPPCVCEEHCVMKNEQEKISAVKMESC